jgi:hypothetical protein
MLRKHQSPQYASVEKKKHNSLFASCFHLTQNPNNIFFLKNQIRHWSISREKHSVSPAHAPRAAQADQDGWRGRHR